MLVKKNKYYEKRPTFNEIPVCLNCPRKTCIYDKRRKKSPNGTRRSGYIVCPVIKEAREKWKNDHKREVSQS